MKRSLWEPKRRIELAYQRSLKKLLKEIEKAIAGINDPFKIIEILQKIAHSKEFGEHAESLATKMATYVFTDAGRNWKEAARVNSKGKSIYEALQGELSTNTGLTFNEIIKNNSKLIKSLPSSLAEYTSEYVGKESLKGKRHTEIARELQDKFPTMNKNKATLIARTESSKASTALSESRSKEMGLKWYIWNTSKDSRVRDSHSVMDRVIVNWNDPPSPEVLKGGKGYGEYHAGNTFNCRCFPSPIVTLARIKFPAKVYHEGKIQTMTKAEFERIA